MQVPIPSRIPSNYVLVLPDEDHKFFRTKGGLELAIGLSDGRESNSTEDAQKASNWESKDWSITGSVIKVCDKILYNGYKLAELKRKKIGFDDAKDISRLTQESLEWDTDIEVKEGDRVYFHYISQLSCRQDGMVVNVKGVGECLLIRYDALFAAESKGVARPINGWVWIKRAVTPCDIETSSGILLFKQGVQEDNLAVVIAAAAPIRQYMSGAEDGNASLNHGDVVRYDLRHQAPLEHEYHQTVGLEQIWKIRRKDIYYVIED